VKQPDPKDYPDRVNDYVRAMRRWAALQPRPPVQPIENIELAVRRKDPKKR
jgi:hypothetical protein